MATTTASNAHPLPDGAGELLWSPTAEQVRSSRLAHYQAWLGEHKGVRTTSYDELWRWSTENLDGFWQSIWEHFEVVAEGSPQPVLGERRMPHAQWFPNARLNYAEHIFRNPC
jgi:acetoacetyl-CoA synthetase